jgi:hypothetical protein
MRRIDHIVQHHPARGVDGVVDLPPRAQRGDHHRDLPAAGDLQVVLQPVVGAVGDVIHRERRGRRLRMVAVPGRQLLDDLADPLVELCGRPCVERRKGADDSRLALGDHQLRSGDDEHRAADHRQAQPVVQDGRQGHGAPRNLPRR